MSRRGFLKLGGAGLAGTTLLGAAGCNTTSSESSGGTRTFTYAYEQPEETSHGIAANIFQLLLKDVSGGAIAIEQYPAGQLERGVRHSTRFTNAQSVRLTLELSDHVFKTEDCAEGISAFLEKREPRFAGAPEVDIVRDDADKQ